MRPTAKDKEMRGRTRGMFHRRDTPPRVVSVPSTAPFWAKGEPQDAHSLGSRWTRHKALTQDCHRPWTASKDLGGVWDIGGFWADIPTVGLGMGVRRGGQQVGGLAGQ